MEIVTFALGLIVGVIVTIPLSIEWYKRNPKRIKAALIAIVDTLAEEYEGDNFEVYGTLVIGEKQALAVKVFVRPSEMSDAIATYALKDVDISRIRRMPDDYPTSKEDPSCKSKKV